MSNIKERMNLLKVLKVLKICPTKKDIKDRHIKKCRNIEILLSNKSYSRLLKLSKSKVEKEIKLRKELLKNIMPKGKKKLRSISTAEVENLKSKIKEVKRIRKEIIYLMATDYIKSIGSIHAEVETKLNDNQEPINQDTTWKIIKINGKEAIGLLTGKTWEIARDEFCEILSPKEYFKFIGNLRKEGFSRLSLLAGSRVKNTRPEDVVLKSAKRKRTLAFWLADYYSEVTERVTKNTIVFRAMSHDTIMKCMTQDSGKGITRKIFINRFKKKRAKSVTTQVIISEDTN